MKHVLLACLILMVLGACAGAAIFKSVAGTIGFSLIGLGATIAAMCLMGLKPDQGDES